ncbi:MAG TPA: hypothetical protein VHR97_13720 [Candidatus Baltobacteraceae bacterium]|nr:hypothetical protein [Candidatus Baltobacteraceae bacterium]
MSLLALAAAGLLTARVVRSAVSDLVRYNRLREVSNEPPVWNELPEMIRQVAPQERNARLNLREMLAGLPSDLARYARIKSM